MSRRQPRARKPATDPGRLSRTIIRISQCEQEMKDLTNMVLNLLDLIDNSSTTFDRDRMEAIQKLADRFLGLETPKSTLTSDGADSSL